jgi:hypothetical protein
MDEELSCRDLGGRCEASQSRVTCSHTKKIVRKTVPHTPTSHKAERMLELDLAKATGWSSEVLDSFSEQEKVCQPPNDKYALYISLFLCVGLVVSYLPQV